MELYAKKTRGGIGEYIKHFPDVGIEKFLDSVYEGCMLGEIILTRSLGAL